jgi:hypothetical protein
MYAANEREELSRQALVADAVAINTTGRRYFRDGANAERLVASGTGTKKPTVRSARSRSSSAWNT